MRRLACDRDGAECSRCVKYGFLCAWPAGRATGGRVVVRTREAYLKLAEGRGSTPLRLEKTACAKCRASRRACDGARPVCGRCEAQSFECIYPPQGKRRPKSDDSSPPSSAAEEALPPAVAAVKPDAELPSPVFPYFPAHDPELALAVVNPLAVVPTGDYLALPSNIDEATVNKFTNAYFESVFLKTMVVVLHPQSFFGSLRGAPTVDRTLLAAITWYGALVADADRSISKPFQRRAWRSLLEMRAAFWGQENPPLTLGSAYMASLVIMLYAAWRTVGMGAARRFQEELVRAGWHLGIPFWGTAPTPNLSTKSWIEKQICLYCWWYEGVSSDATLGLATGSDLLLDPRQWATLEMPVEMGNFLSIDANQPLPDYILSLDKLRAETILGWTWLEAGSDARLQILQHLQDPIGIRTNCGVCWSSVLAMLSGQILSDIAILRKWCVTGRRHCGHP